MLIVGKAGCLTNTLMRCHLIFLLISEFWYYYHPYFLEQEIKVLGGSMTFLNLESL